MGIIVERLAGRPIAFDNVIRFFIYVLHSTRMDNTEGVEFIFIVEWRI